MGRLRIFSYHGKHLVLEEDVKYGEVIQLHQSEPEPVQLDPTPWLQLEDTITHRVVELGREIHLNYDFAHAVAERRFQLLANPIMWEAPAWFGS